MSLRDSGHADLTDIHNALSRQPRMPSMRLLELMLAELLQKLGAKVPRGELTWWCSQKQQAGWSFSGGPMRYVLYENEPDPVSCQCCRRQLRSSGYTDSGNLTCDPPGV